MRLTVRKLVLSSLLFFSLGEAAEVSLSGSIESFPSAEIPSEILKPMTGFTSISAGMGDSYAIKGDGSLIGWGSNQHGQLEPLTSPPLPFIQIESGGLAFEFDPGYTVALASNNSFRSLGVFAPGLVLFFPDQPNFTQLSAGGGHCLGLEVAGTIRAWGANGNGQIDVPPGLTNIQSVSAGGNHSLALTSTGQVIAWGSDLEGQTTLPAALPEISQISAGGYHSMALASDGQLHCWGDNTYGQCSPPTFASPIISISAGSFHSLALLQDRTVVAWGANVYPSSFGGGSGALTNQSLVPENLVDVIAISAGDKHSLALHSDGSITQWGQHATPPTRFANVSKIDSGSAYAAIKEDGSLVMWGGDSYGQASPPPHIDKVLDVAVGSFSTAVINSDQTVSVFGFTGLGLADVPADLPAIKSVKAGSRHFLALDFNGNVYAWGDNLDGQISLPPNLGKVVQIEASSGTSFALLEDGTVVGWGEDREGNLAIPADLSNVVSISTDLHGAHVLALLSNGSVVAWGQNFYGEATVPPELSGVVKVSAGTIHSMALLESGEVVAWGHPAFGKLLNLNQGSGAPIDIHATGSASLLFFESSVEPLALDFSFVAGHPLLSFESLPGQKFDIYRSSTLSDLGGIPFLPDYPADPNGETTSFLDSQPLGAKGFYRVVVK